MLHRAAVATAWLGQLPSARASDSDDSASSTASVRLPDIASGIESQASDRAMASGSPDAVASAKAFASQRFAGLDVVLTIGHDGRGAQVVSTSSGVFRRQRARAT